MNSLAITKKIFLNLLHLSFLVLILDYFSGIMLNYLFENQKIGSIKRSYYSMKIAKSEVLLLGSSKTVHGYNSQILKEILDLNVYNAGEGGQSILYQYVIFKANIKRNKPKLVILDVKDEAFKYSDTDYDRLSALLPFYYDLPEIEEIVNYKSKLEKYKLISKSYIHNGSILKLIQGFFKFGYKDYKFSNNGYVPINRKWTGPKGPRSNLYQISRSEIDPIKVKYYKAIIETCKINNIKLIISSSPNYVEGNVDYSVNLAKKIAKNYQIDFVDMSRNSDFLNHKTYFYDQDHLNAQGAKIFTKILALEVNNLIHNKY